MNNEAVEYVRGIYVVFPDSDIFQIQSIDPAAIINSASITQKKCVLLRSAIR